MRTIFRALRWLTFAAFLFGVGWVIYQVLPPRPRWVVEGSIDLQGMLPDCSAAVFSTRGSADNAVIVRDAATGYIRATVAVPHVLMFTRDYKRWLWWQEEGLLAGFDLPTGKEWRTPLPNERNVRSTQLSDDGDLAVLCADHFIYVIAMEDGRILHRLEFGWNGLTPKARFTPNFLILAAPDLDLRIWDCQKRIATSLPIRCASATMSPTGNAMLIEYGDGKPVALVDYPDRTRPIELAAGTAEFSPDSKYLANCRRKKSPDGFELGGTCVDVWDVTGGRLVTTLEDRRAGGLINASSFADGRQLFTVKRAEIATHELTSGRELWRWEMPADSTARYYEPSAVLIRFPQEFLGEFHVPFPWEVPRSFSFEIRDCLSGNLRLAHVVSVRPDLIKTAFSNDGRYLALSHAAVDKDGSVVPFLKKWLPESWLSWQTGPKLDVAIIDIENATLQFEGTLALPSTVALSISNDGRSLFVTRTGRDISTIECWDIPFARPWGWIIGIPAGIGVSVLAWKWLRRKRRGGMKDFLERWLSWRGVLRATSWLAFAVFLISVGWTIYQVLPLRPRWVVRGEIEVKGFLPNSSGVVLVERDSGKTKRSVRVRDATSGTVRSSLHVEDLGYRISDHKRLLWLHEKGFVTGIDLQTREEWRQPLPKERIFSVQFSDDGDAAVLFGDHFIYVIDTRDGKILDQSNRETAQAVPEAHLSRQFVVLAARDRDIRVWDRRQGVATTLPIRCDSATMSPAGNAMLLVNLHNPGGPINPRPLARSLVDFPAGTRPLELGMSPCRFSADGKYLEICHVKRKPNGRLTANKCIDIWDVADRRLVTTLDDRHTDAYINQVFSADGRLLFAVAGEDLAVHELPGGKELWRWKGATEKMIFRYHAPSSALVGIPLSHRFRPKSFSGPGGPEPVETRDAASGRLRLLHLPPPPISTQLDFSNHERYIVLANPIQAEDGPLVGFLKKWLPEGWFGQGDRYSYQLIVFDIEEAACLFEGELRLEHDEGKFRISNDGRSLLVDHAPSNSPLHVIECWEIPFARPWGWIIGIPVGIGVSVLTWKSLRRKRRAAA